MGDEVFIFSVESDVYKIHPVLIIAALEYEANLPLRKLGIVLKTKNTKILPLTLRSPLSGVDTRKLLHGDRPIKILITALHPIEVIGD